MEIRGKYGCIDRTGKIAIKPQFRETVQFSEGLAWISIGNKSGYINRSGGIVIKPLFDGIGGEFSEGLAQVRLNRKEGYKNITRRGDVDD